MNISKEEYFRKIDRLKAIDKSQRAELMWIHRVNQPYAVWPIWRLFWKFNWYPLPLIYMNDLQVFLYHFIMIVLSMVVGFTAVDVTFKGLDLMVSDPTFWKIFPPLIAVQCLFFNWQTVKLRHRIGISWEEL